MLLFRDAEPRLELMQASRAFSFDGDGEAFLIASEAQRIRLAHILRRRLNHDRRAATIGHADDTRHGHSLHHQRKALC